ncbi:hypothetical protein [Mesorhizobium sp. B2-3-12]|uniref:hypothetical protein n=1 Tax=Mesorhizobium sp. B2-3-12 TaxID=2589952 RepID=UPI00112B6454|nr:hypothetical protein [Mesorhizobium sp. B2-3-12]TPL86070.1 hypothetical protein FJ948_23800 [Mesorhizobium sp. B2-3-12]
MFLRVAGRIGPADDKTRQGRALFPGTRRIFEKETRAAAALLATRTARALDSPGRLPSNRHRVGISRMIARAASLAALALVAATIDAAGGDYLHPSPHPEWDSRVQTIYDAATRSVSRKTVSVWDPSPEKGLDFVWEPDPKLADGGLSAEGLPSGSGRLQWRIGGSPSYDPSAVFATYVGSLSRGKPSGHGRLELRTGEYLDGDWLDGAPDGTVLWVDEAGNRYEGLMRHGVADGPARYVSTNGEIFTGTFRDGVRDGTATTQLPGGTTYQSVWQGGREVGGKRPDLFADARMGGLLKAGTKAGQAAGFSISAAIDERINLESEEALQYETAASGDNTQFYPRSNYLMKFWKSGTNIDVQDHVLSMTSWDQVFAFVKVDLSSENSRKGKIASMSLEFSESQAFNKPMLSLYPDVGCLGFSPQFAIINQGWGKVLEPEFHFVFSDDKGNTSTPLDIEGIDDFDSSGNIDVLNSIRQAGADVNALATRHFKCASIEGLEACSQQFLAATDLGVIGKSIYRNEGVMLTNLVGKMKYKWKDPANKIHTEEQPFTVPVSLAALEVPESVAECGSGMSGSPEAAQYQDIHLPLNRKNYSISVPMRGNRDISRLVARFKFHADRSSIHKFRVKATFADGSERQSKPLELLWFRPRPDNFEYYDAGRKCDPGIQYNVCH